MNARLSERCRRAGRVVVSVIIAAAAVSGAGLLVASTPARAPQTAVTAARDPQPPTSQDRVERGKYIVETVGCGDCHTPWKMGPNGPEPDQSRLLSGHPSGLKLGPPPKVNGENGWMWAAGATNTAFAGPWGVSYAANLTPHPVSGVMAVWDEARFIKAIRTGQHFGESGRPIMPPMPWPAFAKMTDEDLKSVYAYLRSIPPIHNEVPDWEPPAGK